MQRFIIWLKFTFFTLRTPNWLRKIFFKMCELDMPEPVFIPGGSIQARGTSLTIIDSEANEVFYVNYNSEANQIYTQRAKDKKIDKVYREREYLFDVNWVLFIMRAHYLFLLNKTYEYFNENRAIGVIE